MAKQIFCVEIAKQNGEECILIPEYDLTVEPFVLTSYLSEGLKNKDIDNGLTLIDENFTKYTFNAKNIDKTIPDHYFVVKINNQLIKEGSPTANTIKSMSENSVKKTSKNMTRLIAGATASFVLITSAVYFIAKELKSMKLRVEEYESKVKYAQEYMENHKLTEEAYQQYYIDLEQSAKSGDADAQKEYNEYLIEQELIKQKEESSKTR